MTSENGAIKRGDAITLSATKPGVGVKATEPSDIIGYALTTHTTAHPDSNGNGVH
ncbi:MAG: hypothetical protein U5L95_00750 [Candidatus Saccharibacteria bacterium]|nr:hypothetical protein [Candidatus Saccharibacteria bacterium]